jgi:hypothetical protein
VFVGRFRSKLGPLQVNECCRLHPTLMIDDLCAAGQSQQQLDFALQHQVDPAADYLSTDSGLLCCWLSACESNTLLTLSAKARCAISSKVGMSQSLQWPCTRAYAVVCCRSAPLQMQLKRQRQRQQQQQASQCQSDEGGRESLGRQRTILQQQQVQQSLPAGQQQ